MEKLRSNICQVCGGALKNCGTYYKCICCDTEYRIDEAISKEETDAYFRKMNAFEDAERNLRVNPPKFDDAESEFELIVQKYPDWSAGYWGLVRAKFGIKFEQDSDDKAVPSCYKSTYEDFRNTDEYKKAVALAETPELRQSYEKMAEYIARVAKEWREDAQKYDYDVFISFKASNDLDDSETQDSREMQNLYTYLTQQGYRVFFSPVTLRTEGYSGRRGEPYIFNALDKSEALIVYGSRKEYFTAPWVQNEWQRYLRAMERGRRPKNSLLVLYEGFNPKELPLGLRRIQAIDYNSKTAYNEVLNVLQNIFERVREEEAAPALELIHIEAGKVGKRVASVGERIGTVQLGTAVVPKNAKRTVLSVQMRELGTASHKVDKEQSKFNGALACLRNGFFDEARRMFGACLQENDKNGDLWLGKLCADLKDKTLYDEIKGEAPETPHSAEVVQDYTILQKTIDYAADKPTAERLLSYVFEQLAERISKTLITPSDADTIFKLYKLCGDYNSENSQKMRRLLSQNADKLARVGADDLLDYLIVRIPDVKELIPTLEKVTNVFLGKGQFDKAARFNDRIQELDEANPKVLMNAFYIANSLAGKEALIASAEGATDFSVLEKGLPNIAKADAEKILSVLCEAEAALLRRGRFAEAERYFSFIVKYGFAGRDNFLRHHVEFLDAFAAYKRISFYEKLLSAYPDRSTEFHLKSRLAFADNLLSKGYFSEAEAMYNKVLELESENGAALQGLLYSSLKIFGEGGGSPQWQNWDQKLFERVLAACPNKKTQSDLVNKMCKLCIESMKKQGRNVGGSAGNMSQEKVLQGNNESANRDAGHNEIVMIDGAYYKRNFLENGTGGYDYDDNYYKNRGV